MFKFWLIRYKDLVLELVQLLCPLPSQVFIQGNIFKPMIKLITMICMHVHLVFKVVYTKGYILSIHVQLYVHVRSVWPRPPVDLSVLCWYWHFAVEPRHVSAQTFLSGCASNTTFMLTCRTPVLHAEFSFHDHMIYYFDIQIGCFSWVFKWRTDNVQVF